MLALCAMSCPINVYSTDEMFGLCSRFEILLNRMRCCNILQTLWLTLLHTDIAARQLVDHYLSNRRQRVDTATDPVARRVAVAHFKKARDSQINP